VKPEGAPGSLVLSVVFKRVFSHELVVVGKTTTYLCLNTRGTKIVSLLACYSGLLPSVHCLKSMKGFNPEDALCLDKKKEVEHKSQSPSGVILVF